MNTRDFCYWMQGYCELTENKQPTTKRWGMINEHLELTNEPDKSGIYEFDHFVEVLNGFLEVNGLGKVTTEQWNMITKRLQDCFDKVTSTMDELSEEKELKDVLEEILKDKDTKPWPYLPPAHPLMPDRHPFMPDTPPWKQGDIVCSNEPKSDVFCSSAQTVGLAVPVDIACATLVDAPSSLVEFARRDAEDELVKEKSSNLEGAYDQGMELDMHMFDDAYWK